MLKEFKVTYMEYRKNRLRYAAGITLVNHDEVTNILTFRLDSIDDMIDKYKQIIEEGRRRLKELDLL